MKRKAPKLTINPDRAARAQARVKSIRKKAPLAAILHPNWSSREDYQILMLKADGYNFSAIAERVGRTRLEVEQRFHRLRGVNKILDRLEAFGISKLPYEMEDGAC